MTPPHQLGPFRLLSVLGRGAMGEVWRALHEEEGLEVAVKLIPAVDEAASQAVRTEVRAVAGLQHPGVVCVVDHGTCEGFGWLVMELAPEGTVADHPPRGEPEVHELVVQILDALAHTHARGVIHRDLKPSNLLWIEGRVKLADFGVAHLGAEGVSGVVGTPGYMAPEQITGAPWAQGPWTDLYALGCMVYEWLEGRRAFEGLQAHLEGAPRPLTRHQRWWPWLSALLSRAPEARPRSAAEALWSLPSPGEAVLPWAAPAVSGTVALTQAEGVSAELAGATLVVTRPARPLPEDWRVLSPVMRRLPVAGLGLFDLRPVPLVGRQAQRDLLWRSQRLSASGALATALSGPAGVGKSRLAAWCGRRLLEAGGQLWRGEGGLGPMLVRGTGVLGAPRRRWPALWTRWLYHRGGRPQLVEALRELISPGEGSAFRTAGERYGAVAAILRLGGGPTMLWLDDLHEAPDAAGLGRYLLDHQEPVHVVATVRDDLDDTSARAVLEHPSTRRVEVGPLERAHWLRLIQGMVGVDEALASQLGARSAGNPMFAVQLVRDGVARGVLRPGARGLVLASGAELRPPASVSELWRQRLEGVLWGQPPEARRALVVAAALGVRVSGPEWLGVCAQLGLPPAPKVLEALLDANLARGTAEAWSFAHGMLREVVLGEDPHPHATHLACAEVLRGQPGRVGQHLVAAGRPREALEPLWVAAKEANAQLDYHGALALLRARERALDGLEDHALARAQGDTTRALLYRNLGQLSQAAELATSIVERGHAEDPAWGDVLAQAWCLRSLVSAQRGRHEEALEAANKGLALGHQRHRHHSYRIHPLLMLQRHEEALVAIQGALADPALGPKARAEVLRLRGELCWRTGALEEGLRWTLQAWEASVACGDRSIQALATAALGAVHQVKGDYPQAMEWYLRAVEVVGGPEQPEALVPRTNLCVVYALQERFDEARSEAERVLARVDAMGRVDMSVYARAALWASLPPQAQDALFPVVLKEVAASRAVDSDFVLLARGVAKRRRGLGDVAAASAAEAFAQRIHAELSRG